MTLELTTARRPSINAAMTMLAPSAPGSVAAIAERLRATREALGLNQREFGRRAGIAPNTYNQYETGKGRPQLDMALQLCAAYRLTLDWIYLGDPSGLPHHLARKINAPAPAAEDTRPLDPIELPENIDLEEVAAGLSEAISRRIAEHTPLTPRDVLVAVLQIVSERLTGRRRRGRIQWREALGGIGVSNGTARKYGFSKPG